MGVFVICSVDAEFYTLGSHPMASLVSSYNMLGVYGKV